MFARMGPALVLPAMFLVFFVVDCREVPDSVAPATQEPTGIEERDFFHLGGTRYVESVPGTDRYYVYEVRFRRRSENTTYSLKELVALEQQGLLREDDPIEMVWYRTREPIPGDQVLHGATGLRFSKLNEMEQPPPCPPPCCTWDSVTRECNCDTSWSCVKKLFQ